jgi:hypothetical protein
MPGEKTTFSLQHCLPDAKALRMEWDEYRQDEEFRRSGFVFALAPHELHMSNISGGTHDVPYLTFEPIRYFFVWPDGQASPRSNTCASRSPGADSRLVIQRSHRPAQPWPGCPSNRTSEPNPRVAC